MEYLILVAAAIIGIIGLRFTKEKAVVRVSWDKVAQFCGFLFLLTVIRVSYYDFLLQSATLRTLPTIPPVIMANKWTLLLVFWEDFFFGIPLYYIHKLAEKYKYFKIMKWPLTIMIVSLFGLGHAYQGPYGMTMNAFLLYFVCLRFGRLYGFGTTMICHILYDAATVYSIILLPYLLGL